MAFALALKEESFYRVLVPSGVSQLTVTVTPSTGDADLRVRRDSPPWQKGAKTGSGTSCSSSKSGTLPDKCLISSPVAGQWFVRVFGFTSSKGTVLVTYSY
jgi:serine protease